MRFLTDDEARAWFNGWVPLDHGGHPQPPEERAGSVRCALPAVMGLTWFCRHLVRALEAWDTCVLWVTTWGVWSSAENLHLYYQLRRAYGDVRLLHEAPAHLFLEYETADLVSFLQIGIICGWDMHLVPQGVASAPRIFVSRDEYVSFAAELPELAEEFAAPLDRLPPRPA